MKNKNILLVVCVILLVSVLALGCSPAERPVPETAPNQNIGNNNRTTNDNTMPRTDQVVPGDNRTVTDNRMTTDNRTTRDNGLDGDLSGRANRIETEVTKLNDVENATVVITGNTALVGVNLTSGTKGDLNKQIKNQVEDTIKKTDRDIDRVVVTSDPDLFTRIGNVARDIGEGRPLSGFGQEIEEIIRRITPGA